MLIEKRQDSVLRINEKQAILSINYEAKNTLRPGDKSVIHQSALDICCK
ncbi:hypothetical protein SAMN05421821_10163 [Mucilaginibacter lappiensis]|uniref:Uncharacterized protein n=1 Tax=Mucilaginibacter lappiensis TaxID=354630 RepID=A0A1N6NB48_9SPHI|nr:hypothetical protein [Mucilaginibacter lappiensis]MBB6125904.1 hypothetical protein [Mucilaginibacter lappiensis]SIP89290.1 hypothetical protein SAMN05421821_10163 [Mucilaginibacter lappiensis]